MALRVFVETNDRYLWTLAPFAYLFNLYWSSLQPVVVFGYSPPIYRLPPNFTFYSIDDYNYPPEKWSDGVRKVLQAHDDDHIVLLLCDYWLSRTVDVRGVDACHQYIIDRPEVLRCDLTDDRLYAGGMFPVESYGSYDIIETPAGTPYQMSTQAGIWNRELFLALLEEGKSAWHVEIHTNPPESMRVLGTRQCPVRYANAILKGKIDHDQLSRIPEPHRSLVTSMIPYGWEVEVPA